MNPEPPTPPATSKSRTVQWPACAVLILIGGTLLVALVAAVLGAGSGALPILVVVALYFGGFFALKFAFHPIRGRADESRSWREQFPTCSEQEVDRFLRVVGDELGLRKERWPRLRPDDRVTALTQEAFCGDGMDIIELVMSIEEEYALELPDAFLEQAKTLGNLFDYVTRHGDRRQPSPSSEPRNEAERG